MAWADAQAIFFIYYLIYVPLHVEIFRLLMPYCQNFRIRGSKQFFCLFYRSPAREKIF